MRRNSYVIGPIISVLGTLSVYYTSFLLASESKSLFGQYSEFIFFLNIFLASAGMSLDIQIIRCFIEKKESSINDYFLVGFSLNSILAVLYVFLLCFLYGYNYLYTVVMLVAQFWIVFVCGILQAKKKYILMSCLLNSANIFRLTIIYWMVTFLPKIDMGSIVNMYVYIHMFIFLVSVLVFSSIGKDIPLLNGVFTYKGAKMLFILSLAPFIHMIIYQSDIIILSQYYNHEVIANYSLAVTIITGIYYFPSLISNRYLLRELMLASESRVINFKIIISYVSMSFLLVLALYLLSDYVYLFFFPEYLDSVYILEILLVGVFFRLLSIPLGSGINIESKASKKVLAMLFVAMLNVSLNVYFVPDYAIQAVIFSTLISEIVLFILYVVIFKYD